MCGGAFKITCLCTTFEAPFVQEISRNAELSGAATPMLSWMASLGSYGAQPQNIHRALMQRFCKKLSTPEPYSFNIPVVCKENSEFVVKDASIDMLLPHEWLSSVSAADCENILVDRMTVKDFWRNSDEQQPKLQNHPMKLVRSWHSTFIPFMLHGDAAEFQERDSLMIISMRSILTSLPISASQLLIAALPKSCATKATWHQIWTVVKWSFTALFEGRHPLRDHEGNDFPEGSTRKANAGKPLTADGMRGVLFCLAGDMQFFSDEIGFAHSAANAKCSFCQGNNTTHPWNDLRSNAKWRTTLRDSHEIQHPVMEIPGVTIQTFTLDVLHVIDLGVSVHLVGNLLFEFVFCVLPGNRPQCMSEVNKLIQTIYVEKNISADNRVKKLDLKDFCADRAPFQSYPCLVHAKAREVRYLVPVIAVMANRLLSQTNEHQHMKAAADSLAQALTLIDQHPIFMPARAVTSFTECVDNFGLHYMALSKLAFQAGHARWSMVPKHHYFMHMPSQA
jgi:hypothetical protein